MAVGGGGIGAIGLLIVIALTVYGSVVERSREYGIVKALGADRGRLYRLVLVQSLLLAAAGTLAGIALFAMGVHALGAIRPQFAVVVTHAAAARVLGAALLMGVLATWLPARRLVAMEPSLAFGGG